MPSGRTSTLVLQANDLLATHPACSEKRHNQPCRRPHERKLGDQTKDDIDKEPRVERSCGRSQALLYNSRRPHSSLDGSTPDQAYFTPLPLRMAALPRQRLHLSMRKNLFRQPGPAHSEGLGQAGFYPACPDPQQVRVESMTHRAGEWLRCNNIVPSRVKQSNLHVRSGRAPCKGGAFQWVQAPPGNRSSRKQLEQSWR